MPRGGRSAQPGGGLLPEGEVRSQCEFRRVLQEFRPGPGPFCAVESSWAFIAASRDRNGLRSCCGLPFNDPGFRRAGETPTTQDRVSRFQPSSSHLDSTLETPAQRGPHTTLVPFYPRAGRYGPASDQGSAPIAPLKSQVRLRKPGGLDV
jgi:hypothetical protein